jgi:hypothetical protein
MKPAVIITGGQTGVDLAAWDAAIACGVPTDGWMPHGFKDENGFHTDYAAKYGAREHADPGYQARTVANVGMADAVLILGDRTSPGCRLTLKKAAKARIPVKDYPWLKGLLYAVEDAEILRNWVADALKGTGRRLMVAGNRESSNRGIYRWAYDLMIDVLADPGSSSGRSG